MFNAKKSFVVKTVPAFNNDLENLKIEWEEIA